MIKFTGDLSELVTDLSPADKRKLVQEFSDSENKQEYVDYLRDLRDYNIGIRDTPPDPPKTPD